MSEFVGGPVSIKVTMRKGSWTDDWLDNEIDPRQTVSRVTRTFQVDVQFNAVQYRQTVDTFYKGRADRSGSFKQK